MENVRDEEVMPTESSAKQVFFFVAMDSFDFDGEFLDKIWKDMHEIELGEDGEIV